MDNVTLTNPEATTYRLIINSIYFTVGLFGLICNGLVLVSLRPAKKIHDLLVSGLASADFVNAGGYFAFGIRALILSRVQPYLLSPHQCILEGIHISCFEIGESFGSMMTMFISMDRLLAMVFITRYRSFTKRYAYSLICLSGLYTTGDLIASYVGSALMDQQSTSFARCSHAQNVPEFYYTWHTWHIIACGYASISFYTIAYGTMKFWKKSASLHSSQLKREATVTKRLASIVLITFLLQILTLTINMTGEKDSYILNTLSPYMWSLYALIPSVNVLIYSSTSAEFRNFVKRLIGCNRQIDPNSLRQSWFHKTDGSTEEPVQQSVRY